MKETKNIKKWEIWCKHCHKEEMVQEFIDYLQTARDLAGIPFPFTSGWRCIGYNREIGSKDTSAHPKGLATDLLVGTPQIRHTIIDALFVASLEYDFTPRIIIYLNRQFIHVDVDSTKTKGLWVNDGGVLR